MSNLAVVDMETLGDDFYQNPYPFYAELRSQSPVHKIRMPGGTEGWLVVGYDESRAALADERLSKEWGLASAAIGMRSASPGRHMLASDPPHHTRLRKLVTGVFTQRRVEALAPRVQEITAGLLDAIGDGQGDRVDLAETFCFPLPIAVICELLGVPESGRASLKEWSDHAGSTHKGRRDAAAAGAARYLPELVRDKQQNPGDDLLSSLIKARDEDGDQLSADELLGMVWLLIIAGHETTGNLISSAVFTLLCHPPQLAALRVNPALIDGAVEEFLRYEGPSATSTYRFTTAPVKIGGVVIPGDGELVLIALGDANRDLERFPQPDTLDITRDTRGHMAFGHGIHYCVGAPLARLQGRVAISSLLARFPALQLDGPPPAVQWRRGIMVRGPRSLPVRFR